ARHALRARPGLPGRSVGAALVTGVSDSVHSAGRHQETLVGVQNFSDPLTGFPIVNRGSHGHAYLAIDSASAGAHTAGASLAAAGAKTGFGAKIHERVQPGIADQVNMASVAAIATIGTTVRDVFLPPEADTAVPAVTGL